MERATLKEHLRQAEEHVALGRQHISRQKEIIADLERGDHNTDAARRLLTTFEHTQKMHEADRDRLVGELARLSTQIVLGPDGSDS
jgi:hypothetical protein